MLISIAIYPWTFIFLWILQVTTSLDTDFWSISGFILTHFKPLLCYKLKRWTICPFVLGHPVVNIYFPCQSIWSSKEYSNRIKGEIRTALMPVIHISQISIKNRFHERHSRVKCFLTLSSCWNSAERILMQLPRRMKWNKESL